jgi:hypothetical protein
MYDGLEILVALTENDFLSSRVYGKSASRVMLILVFKVGFADGGVNSIPDFVVVIVVNDKEFVTV